MECDTSTTIVLIEDDLFFRQYKFHKQKLILHRASMREFADNLKDNGYKVEIVKTSSTASMEQLKTLLLQLKPNDLSYYELTDEWLQKRLSALLSELSLQARRYESPGFLTSLGHIDNYFSDHPNRMKNFYEWQRRRLHILMDDDKPVGGKWSYDDANRKKLPKNTMLPPAYPYQSSQHVLDAQQWVAKTFGSNPGNADSFEWPTTHAQASQWLERFLYERLSLFGPYEDAISQQAGQLFHSALSPLLNIGLLTPRQVIDGVLEYVSEHEVPLQSLEGFIRQIIGWREYMRATYVQFGVKMRTSNHFGFDRQLPAGWWNGTVGILPIDTVIKRTLQTGYAHHIERLMILGNSMLLLRIDPDQVYEWFMSLFIDAYDWVMVPNVYAMSQFAVGEMITTKPYISGSNYIHKMSDFTVSDWSEIWNALYWQFIHDHRATIAQNYRLNMVIGTYERFDATKKQHLAAVAAPWLTS